jgi:hypothetical protein
MRHAGGQHWIELPRDGGERPGPKLRLLRGIRAPDLRRETQCRPPREISADRGLISPAPAQNLGLAARKFKMAFEGLSEAL